MTDPLALDEDIDRQRNNIRTDKLDITYGELGNLYQSNELIIAPDFQRLFRWKDTQKFHFIESLLLGLPIPAFFVAETDAGIWELVDGLQRLSTVFEFFGILRDPDGAILPPSCLTAPTKRQARLPTLDGATYEALSLRSQLAIKRASCRVEVIKIGSRPEMKYEVFERLNTAGSSLTDQEVRNCIFRAQAPQFMDWVAHVSSYAPFRTYLGLSEFQSQTLYDQGLVLRFFSLKNALDTFEHDVEAFVTDYTKEVTSGTVPFERQQEQETFERVFALIGNTLQHDAWRHYRDGHHRGGFSVYVFEALSIGVARNLTFLGGLPPEDVRQKLLLVKADPGFFETKASSMIKAS